MNWTYCADKMPLDGRKYLVCYLTLRNGVDPFYTTEIDFMRDHFAGGEMMENCFSEEYPWNIAVAWAEIEYPDPDKRALDKLFENHTRR